MSKFARDLLFPLIAVVAAFIVGGILILLVGDNPIDAYRLLLGSAFSWPDGIGYTFFHATPLIFTGLAVLVGFRCGLFNIGAEGQLYIAAFATAWWNQVRESLIPVPDSFVFSRRDPDRRVVGRDSRSAEAYFGSHEVINTIMLNFIAIALVSYFTQYHYRVPGDPIMETSLISDAAHIPRIGTFIPGFPERIPLNVAFFLALLCCLLVYLFLWRTKWGYEIRDRQQSHGG